MAGIQAIPIEIVITAVVIVYWALVSLLVIGVLYRRRSRSMQRSAGLTAPSVSPPRRASDPPAAPVEEIASQPFGTTRQVHAPDISPEVALSILSGEGSTSTKPAPDSAATPSQRPPVTPQS
jgi:hypothetical protein